MTKQPAETNVVTDVASLKSTQWKDVEALFGSQGATEGCWCMHWRVETAKDYEHLRGEKAKRCFQKRVDDGVEAPGILGYDTQQNPVGWCSVAPRRSYGQRLHRTGWPQQWNVAEERIWSIVCFYLTPQARGRGATAAMISNAVKFAQSSGAEVIEAYPNDPNHREYSSGELYMGAHTEFVRNGFEEVARPAPGRVTVAYTNSEATTR